MRGLATSSRSNSRRARALPRRWHGLRSLQARSSTNWSGRPGPEAPPDLALIAYSSLHQAVAWRGRPAALPSDRMDGPGLGVRRARARWACAWCTSSPWRLHEATGVRVGVVAAELNLSPPAGMQGNVTDGFVFDRGRFPVTLRPHIAGAPRARRCAVLHHRGPVGRAVAGRGRSIRSTIESARADLAAPRDGRGGARPRARVLVAVVPLRRAVARRVGPRLCVDGHVRSSSWPGGCSCG